MHTRIDNYTRENKRKSHLKFLELIMKVMTWKKGFLNVFCSSDARIWNKSEKKTCERRRMRMKKLTEVLEDHWRAMFHRFSCCFHWHPRSRRRCRSRSKGPERRGSSYEKVESQWIFKTRLIFEALRFRMILKTHKKEKLKPTKMSDRMWTRKYDRIVISIALETVWEKWTEMVRPSEGELCRKVRSFLASMQCEESRDLNRKIIPEQIVFLSIKSNDNWFFPSPN